FTPPPQPPRATQAPTFPTYVTFEHGDDAVTLVGLSIEATAEQVTLQLHWRADRQITRPYVLSLISVAPDGAVHDNVAWNPLNWEYPPTCWAPGREFVDTVRVALGDAPGGEWLFSLAIHDAFSDDVMQVAGTDGGTQYGIGPVTVPAPDA
ncbi:MAG: hypothetical protein K8S97_10020, partial [Anaerolineae bacterium]|nr:hypothetical protein [Anaerolineae bacterium]